MQNPPPVPPKPVSVYWRPELTRLPPLHQLRRLYRRFVCWLARLILRLLTRTTLRGLENLPVTGPALTVLNHLGDADAPLVLATLPRAPETLGKLELLYEFPLLGRLMDWYGIVWVHRGRPDRRALECAVQALREGRCLVIAPEGRYTLAQGLERGSSGAAFISLRAGVPLIPVALTGTQNANVYGSLRRLHRPSISLTVGTPIRLSPDLRLEPRALKDATDQVMRALAALLPPEYRGQYGVPASG